MRLILWLLMVPFRLVLLLLKLLWYSLIIGVVLAVVVVWIMIRSVATPGLPSEIGPI